MKQRSRKNYQSGFTIIELLVVIAIIGFLMAVVGPRVMGALGGAKTDTARMSVQQLASAVDMYALHMGSYPTENEGLEALVKAPAGKEKRWQGPYTSKPTLPKDPWGNDFVYRRVSDALAYEILSYGADGQPGGEGENADISSRD